MGRIFRVNEVHRNAVFIINENFEYLHFLIIQDKIKLNFDNSHFGASIFFNKKNATKFIEKNKIENVQIIKARPVIKKAIPQ